MSARTGRPGRTRLRAGSRGPAGSVAARFLRPGGGAREVGRGLRGGAGLEAWSRRAPCALGVWLAADSPARALSPRQGEWPSTCVPKAGRGQGRPALVPDPRRPGQKPETQDWSLVLTEAWRAGPGLRWRSPMGERACQRPDSEGCLNGVLQSSPGVSQMQAIGDGPSSLIT